ncbi:MAG: glycoside hydrolase domain-containing protein [Nocardioides sp.]
MFPLLAVVSGSAPADAASGPTSDRRVVRFDGLTFSVPRGWPVRRFASGSAGCVRLDRHAVYLGQPDRSTCPPHLVGTVTAVQVLRGTDRLTGDHTLNPHGLAVFGGGDVDGYQQVQAASGGARVQVTTGGRPALADEIVASVRQTGRVGFAQMQNLGGREAPQRRSTAAATHTSTGLGFDACSAPSVKAMQAWGASPYRTIGVYVGGVARACSQPHLTASWINTLAGMGWAVVPTYVGLQAPCTRFTNRIAPSRAAAQGAASATDAVSDLQALGLPVGSPVYFDMESYPTTSRTCVKAVRTFLDRWTARLHSSGYRSGVYSSVGSGITQLVKAAQKTSFHAPDDIWYARWDDRVSTTGDPYVPDTMWSDNQRIHQYRGGHNETHGGVTINIDSDAVDADTVGPPGSGGVAVHTTTAVNLRPGPSVHSGAALATMPRGTTPSYHCWAKGQAVNGVDVWFNVTYGTKTGYYTAAYSSSSFSRDSQITTRYGLARCGAAAAVRLSPSDGRRSTVFAGFGSGFSPRSTVTQRLVQPDGTRYPGTFTQRSTTNRSGSFKWSWTWRSGDQFGRYTLVSVDVSGVRARASYIVYRGAIRNTSAPTVTGTTRVGMTLTASPGTWSKPGVSLTYEWLRGGLTIGGQTAPTYTLRPADQGSTISVRVRATKPDYAAATATSTPTSPVALGLMVCPDQPTVTGRLRTGRTVTATSLGCTSPTGVAYRYRWLRDGRAIRGATHRTYTLRPADRGDHLKVRVRAELTGYQDAVGTSPARRVSS